MELHKRYILPILLILFSITSLEASGKTIPSIKTSYVYARGGESLKELLEYQVGIPQRVLDKDGYLAKIKRWNPSLEKTSSLHAGERVYVEIPYRVVLSPRLSPQREIASTKNKANKMAAAIKRPKDKKRKGRWNFSIFYALSRGSFQASIQNYATTTNSTQDSPLTLGVATYKTIGQNFSYSGSLYVSKLNSGVSDQNTKVSIPVEYGLNSYIGYKRENWPLEVYSGVDFERFSSYNTEELPSGAALSTRQHRLTFVTLGVSKLFRWFGKKFLTKVSYAQSIISSQSRLSTVNPKAFTGSKFMLYLNMKASKDWFYHVFYKQHNLKGATSLKITRTGLGFGYSF